MMEAILNSFNRIDKSAAEPIYQQIKKTIADRISHGDWVAGQKLPSENELVNALDVSRMTINRALRELTQQGLINRVHGLGSFVADLPRHASLIELQDIALEIAERGKHHKSKLIVLESRQASADIARKMLLETGSKLFYLEAVHYQDDLPVQHEARYVNPNLVPGFIHQDFNQKTSTAYLLQQFRPDEMEHIVRAMVVDVATCKLLEIERGEPCLQLNRRTWINQQVVTQVTLTYPGNRYDLGARYATNDYHSRSQSA